MIALKNINEVEEKCFINFKVTCTYQEEWKKTPKCTNVDDNLRL